MSEWVQFAGTVMASGVVAAVVSFLLQGRREDRDYRRGKLEDLYIHAERLCHTLFGNYLDVKAMMTGEITAEELVEHNREENNPESVAHFGHCEMLITFYYGQVRPEWDRVIAIRKRLTEIYLDYKDKHEGVSKEHLDLLLAQLKELNAAKKALLEKLVKLAQ